MAYQSLYRKYRPQTFADVVGQGHVTRTLQNAIESGRIGHGYLFTGTRGTAKTTVARLLAKALNCESADHPVREPCNRCNACIAITGGSAIDVIEMDAASHRGVADIEEVRKAVGYGPMELRYKVFIIDEAHQLSSDAKDAFLKTLEEPPANVVFILATTEPQAIPITIRSRCQQFDFKRGSLGDITSRLRYVLDCEGVRYTPDALTHIARGAEGSYRDSLSLLEQVLAFAPSVITPADVDLVLGTLDSEMLRRVTLAVSTRDAAAAFALAGELLDAGKEARTLLRTLSLHFRDLLLVSVGGPAVAQELTPEEVGTLQEEARAFAPPEMIRAMEILNEAQGETRWNNQHRLLVELTFLKLMQLAPSAPAVAVAPLQSAPARAGTPARPAPAAASPQVTAAPVYRPEPLARPLSPAPIAAEIPPPTPAPYEQPTQEPKLAPVASAPPPAEPDSALPAGYFAADRDLDDDEEPVDTLTGNLFEDEPALAPVAPPPVAAIPNVPEAVQGTEPPLIASEFNMEDIFRVWPEFLNKSATVSRMTGTLMLQSRPVSVRDITVEIAFNSRSAFDMMNQPKSQEFVRKALRQCLGVKRLSVHFFLEEGAGVAAAPRTAAAPKRKERDRIAELESLEHAAPVADGFDAPAAFVPPAYSAPEPIRQTPRAASPPLGNGNGMHRAGAAWEAETPSASFVGSGHIGPEAEPEPTPAASDMRNDPLVQEVLSTFGGEIIES